MNATCFGIRFKFSDVNHLNTDTLAEWVQNKSNDNNDGAERKIVILDVREKEEFSISHLENAIRVSPTAKESDVLNLLKEQLSTLEHRAFTSPNKTTEIVCYCSVGYRSSVLAQMLRKIGELETLPPFNVYSLEGSIFKWANENRPLVNSEGQMTRFVHPYNFIFGQLLNKEFRKFPNDS